MNIITKSTMALGLMCSAAIFAADTTADTSATGMSKMPSELMLMQVKVTDDQGKMTNSYAYVPKEHVEMIKQGKTIQMNCWNCYGAGAAAPLGK